MKKGQKKDEGDEQDQPRRDKNISPESAILLFALLNAGSDRTLIERAFKLALRGPTPLSDMLRDWALSQGEDIDRMMSGEPTTPASHAEVRELAEPPLKTGAEVAALAQLTDSYLFGKEQTPESIVYAFYCGTRFAIVREREPTKQEATRIWQIALLIARHSKIAGPYWRELESRGTFSLEDWIEQRKEVARKRFETFLRRKKRAEVRAEKALESLMSRIFGDDDDKQPPK